MPHLSSCYEKENAKKTLYKRLLDKSLIKIQKKLKFSNLEKI